VGSGILVYVDHVRISPQMGPHTHSKVFDLFRQIELLDQGILRDAKSVYGLGYNTRYSLINQSPAVVLDYSAAHLASVPKPVFDDKLTRNDIVVKRHKGSTVRVTGTGGAGSVLEPPAGVGQAKHRAHVVANTDLQLLALAAHLLNLGTNVNERYPQIIIDMTRPAVANLFSAIAGTDIGQYVQIINLPPWFPGTTIDQLVVGYTETLNAFKWIIEWNGSPYAPWQISATSLRRW
jgi:hypothetical protein